MRYSGKREYRIDYGIRSRGQNASGTFFDYAQAWLDDPTNDWTKSSRDKFRGILERVWLPSLKARPIRLISPADLTKALAAAVLRFKHQHDKEPSKSLFNDWLLCVRGVFATSITAGAIKRLGDPSLDLQNETRDKTDPDPFDTGEANAMIATAYADGDMTRAWFELGFYNGMRYPSEPAALTWSDIDLRKGEVRISKIMTKSGQQNTTKTKKSRILFLNSRSVNALERLKPLTHPAGGLLFINSHCGDFRHAITERKAWRAILTKLEIRYRDLYNVRHTYATFGLMNGVNPFMTEQLGHSGEGFFKPYATWINTNQNQLQIELIQQAIAAA